MHQRHMATSLLLFIFINKYSCYSGACAMGVGGVLAARRER